MILVKILFLQKNLLALTQGNQKSNCPAIKLGADFQSPLEPLILFPPRHSWSTEHSISNDLFFNVLLTNLFTSAKKLLKFIHLPSHTVDCTRKKLTVSNKQLVTKELL